MLYFSVLCSSLSVELQSLFCVCELSGVQQIRANNNARPALQKNTIGIQYRHLSIQYNGTFPALQCIATTFLSLATDSQSAISSQQGFSISNLGALWSSNGYSATDKVSVNNLYTEFVRINRSHCVILHRLGGSECVWFN